MRTIRKGEIWDVATATEGRAQRVLVVSSDEWHEAAPPQVAVVVRRHQLDEILPFVVLLHEEVDSVTGVVLMDSLTPVDPADFLTCVGSVGGPTLTKIDTCLGKIYGL